jgi:hypothetical protein
MHMADLFRFLRQVARAELAALEGGAAVGDGGGGGGRREVCSTLCTGWGGHGRRARRLAGWPIGRAGEVLLRGHRNQLWVQTDSTILLLLHSATLTP